MPRKSATATEPEMNDQTEESQTGAETPPPAATRPRKLEKDLSTKPGTVIIKVLGGSGKDLEFDTALLSEDIRVKLIPFGAGHKLGDAAAGREGMDAEEAILKVWEGLLANDWSVRAPASPKVSLKDLTTNLAAIPDDQKPAALALLKELGIKIPGVTD